MPIWDFYDYLTAISPIYHREFLSSINAASWPNMKKRDREKQHREIHRLAYPNEWEDSKKPMSTEEIMRLIQGGFRK